MKLCFNIAVLTISFTSIICAAAAASPPGQDPRLRIETLSHLAETASEYVEVNLEGPSLRSTLNLLFFERSAVSMSIGRLLSEQEAIYIRSFQFDRAGEYSQSDLASIRAQLGEKGWSRVKRRPGILGCADLELHVYQVTGSTRGLAMICSDPGALTVVNIIGPISLERLDQLTALIERSRVKN